MSRWSWRSWSQPPALVAVTAFGACVLAALLFVPFLTVQRVLVAGTPSPRPLFSVSLIEIPAGEQLCISDVTIPPRAQELHLSIGTFGLPGPRLELDLRAPGYRERIVVPAGYADNTDIVAAMTPPATARVGRVCVIDRGATKLALIATTEERTASRPVGRLGAVGGGAAATPVAGDAYLAFYERGSASVMQRTHEIVERMGAFRPGVVGAGLLWALVALVLVGVPAGVVAAALIAVRGARED